MYPWEICNDVPREQKTSDADKKKTLAYYGPESRMFISSVTDPSKVFTRNETTTCH